MSNNPNSNNGNRRRRGGRNRGPRGNRDEAPRTPKIDDRSGFQKLLNTLSFGLLCKGPSKSRPKAPITNTTVVKSPRPEGGQSSSPRPPREPKPMREFAPANPAEVTTERLYVGNLSYDASESDLFELFNGVGSVRNAEVVVHSRTQRSKGFAFVTMATLEEARRAVGELSGKEFMGRPLQISGAKPSNRGDRDERSEESQPEEAAAAA